MLKHLIFVAIALTLLGCAAPTPTATPTATATPSPTATPTYTPTPRPTATPTPIPGPFIEIRDGWGYRVVESAGGYKVGDTYKTFSGGSHTVGKVLLFEDPAGKNFKGEDMIADHGCPASTSFYGGWYGWKTWDNRTVTDGPGAGWQKLPHAGAVYCLK